MTDELPIVFGVTGHRDIPVADVETLARAVRSIFDGFRLRYPSTPFLLLTPLAAGADRLVARVALDAGIPIRVPMPFDEAEYRKDFSVAENAEFDELSARSIERYALPFEGDTDGSNVADHTRRAGQYAAVGRYLARNVHVLIALWNGVAAGASGGTADVVRYRLFATNGVVYHVVARRDSDRDAPAGPAPGTIVVKTRFGDVEPSADPDASLYDRIERSNREAATRSRSS